MNEQNGQPISVGIGIGVALGVALGLLLSNLALALGWELRSALG